MVGGLFCAAVGGLEACQAGVTGLTVTLLADCSPSNATTVSHRAVALYSLAGSS